MKNRIATQIFIVFALVFAFTLNAGAQMSCESLFGEQVWVQTKRGLYSLGQLAALRQPSVLKIETGFLSASTVLNWDGSFDVFVTSRSSAGDRTKRIFNSKPSVLKILNPLKHRYSNNFVAYPVVGKPLKPLPLVFVRSHLDFLLHGQGDLTRLDVWETPFKESPKEIDAHQELFGFRRRDNQEVGYIINRNTAGIYAKSNEPVPWIKPVIGQTAFLASIHQQGIVYGLYEVLNGWSGGGVFRNAKNMTHLYFEQRLVLLQFDLRHGFVRKLGEHRAEPADLFGERGHEYLSEDHRAQQFKIIDQTWQSIQVVGIMKDGSETTLIDAPIPKPLGPPNRTFNPVKFESPY